MTDTASERCDCPDEHLATVDGRCDNPPLWMDDPETLDRNRWSECGCCMADCQDVHLEPKPIRAVPGSMKIAAEHVATLPAEKQSELREAEARGETADRATGRDGLAARKCPDPAQRDETSRRVQLTHRPASRGWGRRRDDRTITGRETLSNTVVNGVIHRDIALGMRDDIPASQLADGLGTSVPPYAADWGSARKMQGLRDSSDRRSSRAASRARSALKRAQRGKVARES